MPDEQKIMSETTLGGGSFSVSVWRGDANGGGYQHYDVPKQDRQTVRDVVT